MKIPRQEDIALLLMGELAKHSVQQSIPLSSISDSHGISVLFLKKIARLLRQATLIESKEGVSGGYRLARDPRTITVWEIIQAVASENPSVSHELKTSICPLFSQCLPQQITKRVYTVLEKSFSRMKVSDLV